MKRFSVGHRCDFCGQEIVYLLPDSAAEAFGTVFQEPTFLELRSLEIRDPSRRVAEYWYCSDYCAREDLDVRINHREEQMRQYREANRLGFCFFSWSDPEWNRGRALSGAIEGIRPGIFPLSAYES